jgi:hypothetical protein
LDQPARLVGLARRPEELVMVRIARRLACLSTAQRLVALGATTLLSAALLTLGSPVKAEGLKLNTGEVSELRWQARVQLSSLDRASGARLLSANLLGDYYLTSSGLGQNVRGGLRATGGLMLGAASLAQSSGGLALGNSSLAKQQMLSFGQRQLSFNGLGAEQEPSQSSAYLGIGYTGQSLRGGWGFSADLGLRLGRSAPLPTLEDTLMELRLRPVLHFGLSYSY